MNRGLLEEDQLDVKQRDRLLRDPLPDRHAERGVELQNGVFVGVDVAPVVLAHPLFLREDGGKLRVDQLAEILSVRVDRLAGEKGGHLALLETGLFPGDHRIHLGRAPLYDPVAFQEIVEEVLLRAPVGNHQAVADHIVHKMAEQEGEREGRQGKNGAAALTVERNKHVDKGWRADPLRRHSRVERSLLRDPHGDLAQILPYDPRFELREIV